MPYMLENCGCSKTWYMKNGIGIGGLTVECLWFGVSVKMVGSARWNLLGCGPLVSITRVGCEGF